MIILKVNLQKIIALTVVITVIMSILSISVYALDLNEAENNGWHETDKTIMTSQEYYSSQAYLISQYCDGKITYEEFQERSQAITDDYVTSNTVGGVLQSGALTASNNIAALSQKIGATVQKYGDSAREYVSEWISDFMDEYSVLSQKPTTDMMGGGAKAVITYANGSERVFTCEYIIVDTTRGVDNTIITLRSTNGECYQYDLQKDGTYKLTWQSGGSANLGISGNGTTITDFGIVDKSGNIYKLYGDVRTIEGEKFPTDDEYELVKDYDFTEFPETALEDLINNMTEEFERQEPDLSTIEGLLKAIYARMGKLDSDNDNQLLSQILVAIKSIKNTDTDNSDLLSLLEEIKKSLVYNDGENTETLSELLKKIIDNQITSDDFVIDEDLYNNHSEVLKARLLGKFSFIYNMKTFIEYCFDKYSNTSEIPEFNINYNGKSYSIDLNAFNEHLPTIQWILAAFTYLTYAYHTYRKIPSYINGGDNE